MGKIESWTKLDKIKKLTKLDILIENWTRLKLNKIKKWTKLKYGQNGQN